MSSKKGEDTPCPTCGISRAAFEALSKRVEELEKRLSAYENSNSPPSKNTLLYRELKKKRKFVSKLKSASTDLFTFTLYRGVDPTNSHAERQLREPIVHRKIRGQLKSEKGMIMFSRLLTAASTWKLQELNPFAEFKKCL